MAVVEGPQSSLDTVQHGWRNLIINSSQSGPCDLNRSACPRSGSRSGPLGLQRF